MLDNLRDQASFQPGEELPSFDPPKKVKPRKQRRSFDQLVGMTAPQRFVLSVMVLAMVCLLSVMCLLVTERVVPPI